MPNYCMNTATIKHDDPEVISKLAQAFIEDVFLQAAVPMPDKPEPATKNLEALPDWYRWRVENWGTKWDIGIGSGGSLNRMSLNEIIISFDSAWAPPVEAYTAMVLNGFDVEAKYFEPGMCFCGSFSGGFDTCLGFDDVDDIPSDIANEFNVWDWFGNEEDE